ncbi:MAG TPA: hypothetical protein PL009_02415 [Flavipsychrobacter sp.]|nr:hypothetical protein [Flavipsychrobacter sp.]
MKWKFLVMIIAVFAVLSAVFYGVETYAPDYRFNVLMGGNLLMAVLSVASFFIVTKTINERPQAFVRGVYGATFLKLMVCMASILVYALLNKKNIHKPSLFVLFGIYAVYTVVETWMLSKLARGAK